MSLLISNGAGVVKGVQGFVSIRPALERFAANCMFDPTTGCVIWTGGTTSGRGNSAKYGAFWYEGKRWASHRWAAVHIHKLPVEGVQVGHCCKPRPRTLCVEHVEPQTQLENLAEQHERRRVVQSAQERQFYLFVSLGLEQEPPQYEPLPGAVPFYRPPAWFTAARPDYVLPELSDVPF